MKRFFQSLFAAVLAVALAGCAGIPGGDGLAAAGAVAADVLTGPDTDYKNYLSHCSKEVAAQQKAAESESTALANALNSSSEKTQFGALILLAVKSGDKSPKIGCSVSRKKSIPELLLTDNSLLELGKDLYFESRDEKRFKAQLEFDAKALKITTDAARDARRDNNRFISDLTGTRPDEANRSRAEAERLPLPDAPN